MIIVNIEDIILCYAINKIKKIQHSLPHKAEFQTVIKYCMTILGSSKMHFKSWQTNSKNNNNLPFWMFQLDLLPVNNRENRIALFLHREQWDFRRKR